MQFFLRLKPFIGMKTHISSTFPHVLLSVLFLKYILVVYDFYMFYFRLIKDVLATMLDIEVVIFLYPFPIIYNFYNKIVERVEHKLLMVLQIF